MKARIAFLAISCLIDVGGAVAQTDVGWKDLLAKDVDATRGVVAGSWSRSKAGLRTRASTGSRFVLPVQVPREYDLQVEFTRHSGEHSVAVFFTSGTGRASFEIDAWSQNLAGIQLIGGKDCRENSTRTANQKLRNNRRYTAEVRVRKMGVTVRLDGKTLATYKGDGSDLSLVPLWRLPKGAQIAVGAYQAETTFHSVRLRSASGEPVVNRRGSPMKKPDRLSTPKTPKDTRDKRVLMVIADHHFFYREYADPKQELERAGFEVETAAGTRRDCYPHTNSGQGRDGGVVKPDLALAEVDPARYSAIVFAGGWGASMYQFAFRGRYNDARYNGDAGRKRAANRLINAFTEQDKYVCGICNGVSVLAWSRVNGRSVLAGKRCTAPARPAPAGVYNGRRGNPSIRWHVQQNQGRLVRAGSIGNPRSPADDVVVDGRIITAEDDRSAREAGRKLAELLNKAGTTKESAPENARKPE